MAKKETNSKEIEKELQAEKQTVKELEAKLKELQTKKEAAKLQEAKDELKTDIRLVRFYQSVSFEKKLGQKQFSYNMDQFKSRKDITMELKRELGFVEIKSAKDHVIVPLANIAYIQVFCESTKEEAVVAKQALG